MAHILPPDFSFATLRTRLADLGWAEDRLPALLPPLIAGEPETAKFSKCDQRLDYEFNPAILLRVLRGPVPDGLPGLDPASLPDRIASADHGTAFLGAAAAAELRQTSLRPAILLRATRAPPELARHVMRAAHRLSPLCAEALHFADLPPERQRQALRLALEHASPDAADLMTLGLAAAPDIAATAMIGAARLGLSHLRPAFRRPAEGGELFSAIRKAALATLSGQRPGSEDTARNRFWRALLGQGQGQGQADMAIRLAPLTVPLPMRAAPQIHGGIAFCRIDAIPHWLGDPDRPGTARRRTPRPFLIAETPLLTCTAASVMGALDDLCAASGLALRLPADEELQCALRGPDGRLHPSGRADDPGTWQSPWGLLAGPVRPEICTIGHIVHFCRTDRPTQSHPVTIDGDPAGLRPVLGTLDDGSG